MHLRPQTTTSFVTIARNAVLSTATFAAMHRTTFPILGWRRALISFRFSQTRRSDTISPHSCAWAPSNPIPLSHSLSYTHSLMTSGCNLLADIPHSSSKSFEISFLTSSHTSTNTIESIISRKPALCGTRSPNQAMQRTAGRSPFPLSMTFTFNLEPRAPSPAVADLVSR